MPDYCLLGQHCYCGIGLRCLNWITPGVPLLHPGKAPDYYEAFMGMPMDRAGGQTYIAALEQLDWLYFGMAVRTRTGVWNLPLCHDSYDEGNG